MARILFTDDAREDVKDLDGSARKIVLKAIKKLEDHPEQRGEPLGVVHDRNLVGFRKLVVGNRDYRIVYQVQNDGDITIIWVVAKRADHEVYDLAHARLAMYADRPLIGELSSLLDDAYERPRQPPAR